MKGRAQLSVPASPRSAERGQRPPAIATTCSCRSIREWASRTETGDRAELEDLPEDLPFWNEVSATAETCLGTECPRYDDCFVTRMRQRAAASDVVIVNHHLLCADAAVRQNAYGEVIPACSNAIVDEAHQLEDVATQYFGFSVSTYRVEDSRATSSASSSPARVDDAATQAELAEGRRSAARSRASVLHRAGVRASDQRAARAARSASARPTQSLSTHARGRRLRWPARSTCSKRRWRCSAKPACEPRDADRRRRFGRRGARPPRRRDPRRTALPAAGRRSRLRLLRRVPRQGHFSARRRRSTCRRSSASCCSTACGRPC